MVPVVAWKIGKEVRYALEGGFSACGTVVNWARGITFSSLFPCFSFHFRHFSY